MRICVYLVKRSVLEIKLIRKILYTLHLLSLLCLSNIFAFEKAACPTDMSRLSPDIHICIYPDISLSTKEQNMRSYVARISLVFLVSTVCLSSGIPTIYTSQLLLWSQLYSEEQCLRYHYR